mmetsp:Transcript_33517/g.58716  ORF Transcript_33517/g.58716 Transcript_33517/m.58716 type:complete len:575 (-) Transcript_33517:509-2233(-)
MPGIIDLNVCFNSDPLIDQDEVTPELALSSYSGNSSSVTSVSSELWEGYDCGTRAAIAGGVTTVLESPTLRYYNMHSVSQVQAKIRSMADATLYCDIGLLGYLSPDNLAEAIDMKETGIFGFKAFLIPPAIDFPCLEEQDIQGALEAVTEANLPLFIHPEKTSERYLYMSSPFRKISEEERREKNSIPSYCFAGAFPEELNPSSSEQSPLSLNSTPQPKFGNPFRPSPVDEKTLERLIRKNQDFMGPLVKAEMNTYSESGSTLFTAFPKISEFLISPNTPERFIQAARYSQMSFKNRAEPQRVKQRPPPITCEKKQKANENTDYAVLVANCPPHWENNGVAIILTKLKQSSQARVHIMNISSASAVQALKKSRQDDSELYITWETSSIYLQFSSGDVSTGDTRFKTNPPIRDVDNQHSLKDLLKFSSIDCVSSYHRPVKPSLKFLTKGDFQRAMNGTCSIGFTLQSTWAALKTKREALCKLAKVLCENPANIAGLKHKGSIEVGKHADLVVWDPYTTIEVGFEEVFYRHPQVSPFLGRQLPGIVHRVFLRGQSAYCPPYFNPLGKVLLCEDSSQ